MLKDYTTAELGLMLIKHEERRVILTQSKIKEIKAEITRRNEEERFVDRHFVGIED